MWYYSVYNDECLMHYGVIGMKWGRASVSEQKW